jgi:hypothetical protein
MSKQKSDATFRASVRTLQNAGLLSPDLDLRKISPTTKIYDGRVAYTGSNTLQRVIDRHDNIISGKATALDLSRIADKTYKKLYEKSTVGGKQFVIVPHSADETVKLERGKVVIKHPAGIDRVQVPVEYHNLEQYLSDVGKEKITKEGKPFFAFRFYGGSSNVFRSMDLLLDELRHYESLMGAVKRGDSNLQRDMFRNLEIVRVQNSRKWFEQREKNKTATGRRKGKIVGQKRKKRSKKK